MAVSFKGVFLSREMSSLFPIPKLAKASISNVTIDHMTADNGDEYEGVKITPLNSNLTYNSATSWHDNTVLNADFNGTIEGGTLSDFNINVNGLAIRRTSNRSNFKVWEDVYVTPIDVNSNGVFDFSYDDIFIESGVLYKYAIQPISSSNRGPMSSTVKSITDYSYSWLIGADEAQLMFAYNPNISNMNIVVKDSLTETIGSRYPFVARSAENYYKQFQFSSLLTHFIDINNVLTNSENRFLDSNTNNDSIIDNSKIYNNFYNKNGLDSENNYIIEREFRNKLFNFLYNGKPKVFKSDTEGLILVILSNITMTPKNELGRVIYDFNCTMTEIGSVDFQTLINYGIKQGVTVNEL